MAVGGWCVRLGGGVVSGERWVVCMVYVMCDGCVGCGGGYIWWWYVCDVCRVWCVCGGMRVMCRVCSVCGGGMCVMCMVCSVCGGMCAMCRVCGACVVVCV